MTAMMRGIVMGAVCLLAVVAGWRIIGQMQAEQLTADDPQAALQWSAQFSPALLALAERHLAAGRLEAAEAMARRVLQQSPLQGQAFRILAQVAERRGDQAQALRLYQIAARRAPRDVLARVWLVRHDLESGHYTDALDHIDRLLRLAPQRGASIFPVLVQMAREPIFSDALAQTLARNPPWRDGLLAVLRDPQHGNPEAAGRLMEALQTRGGLTAEEYDRWLDSLMAQGRWGEAYARWAGSVPKPDGRLPLLYNGDFHQVPSDAGFDWRIQRVPGVLLDFVPVAGVRGQAAYLTFLDRRIPDTGLRHPLLLSPGRYQLRLRTRAVALDGELGLQWQVVCAGPAGVLARSEPLRGNFGWRQVRLDFEVPAQGCPGQWLRLVNAVPDGAAQRISGEFWVTDMSICPDSELNRSAECH